MLSSSSSAAPSGHLESETSCWDAPHCPAGDAVLCTEVCVDCRTLSCGTDVISTWLTEFIQSVTSNKEPLQSFSDATSSQFVAGQCVTIKYINKYNILIKGTNILLFHAPEDISRPLDYQIKDFDTAQPCQFAWGSKSLKTSKLFRSAGVCGIIATDHQRSVRFPIFIPIKFQIMLQS